MSTFRQSTARYLVGSGIELGPGHNPYPVPAHLASVRLLDKWEPEQNRELFPELGEHATFPEPDVVVDLDVDRLSAIGDESVDFVIASHILEHLSNPLRMLDEIHRVTRDGGVAIVLLPDRHHTFDRRREPTSLEHLLAEYDADVHEISQDHIVEYINVVDQNPDPSPYWIDLYQKKTFHVHCWDHTEFTVAMRHMIVEKGHRWALLDGVVAEDIDGNQEEFGYVLRKLAAPVDVIELGRRFDDDWASVVERSRTRLGDKEDWVKRAKDLSALAESQAQELDRLRATIDQLILERDAARAEVGDVRASTSWKVTAPLRRLTRARS